MEVVTTKDFEDFYRDENTKQISVVVFYIQTEKTLFKANSLNDVMVLWRESQDTSKVEDIIKLG